MVRNSAVAARWAKGAPFWVVSLPLLPTRKGQFAQCAGGAYDSYFRDIGANLQRVRRQTTFVRLAGRPTSAPTVTLGRQQPRPGTRLQGLLRRAAPP